MENERKFGKLLISNAIKTHKSGVIEAVRKSRVEVPQDISDVDLFNLILDELANNNGYLLFYLEKLINSLIEKKSNIGGFWKNPFKSVKGSIKKSISFGTGLIGSLLTGVGKGVGSLLGGIGKGAGSLVGDVFGGLKGNGRGSQGGGDNGQAALQYQQAQMEEQRRQGEQRRQDEEARRRRSTNTILLVGGGLLLTGVLVFVGIKLAKGKGKK